MEEIDFSTLSKKERKRLKREMEWQEREKKKKTGTIVKLLTIASLLILLGSGGWLVVRELSKPLPGQQVADLGREHVSREQWETFQYNSNPPTSGPHDPTWVKAGVFSTPQPEGQLIHSLEHGYVILHYNCNAGISNFQFPISNDDKMGTESAESTPSANLPSPLSEQDCDTLKKQLSDLANDKKLWKLIVVPRPNLDKRIALTAWTRIDKMDEFDRDRTVSFIDAYRNKGPEQTME